MALKGGEPQGTSTFLAASVPLSNSWWLLAIQQVGELDTEYGRELREASRLVACETLTVF